MPCRFTNITDFSLAGGFDFWQDIDGTIMIDPGRDIAKAYRLLREKKWRIAMICLDHLEKKYPNWDRIYMAKAITNYILHEPVFMEKALREGCQLGNKTACDDLKNIKKLHEHDFGLSVID